MGVIPEALVGRDAGVHVAAVLAGVMSLSDALGILAVAVWTVVSDGFHAIRLATAGVRRFRGMAVMPWEEEAWA